MKTITVLILTFDDDVEMEEFIFNQSVKERKQTKINKTWSTTM